MNMPTATILIVDDIEANRDVLAGLTQVLGHTPIMAENGLIALEKIRQQPPDIVLLDILMPEMDGFEVLTRIKDDFLLRHIPIIVISAVDEVESIVQCIHMGAEDYLTKPFERTLLKARISACIEKKYLRDLEAHYRQQIEQHNQELERVVEEKTAELAAAYQKLHILNQTKSDFLQLIAYELRQPAKSLLSSVFKGKLFNKLHRLVKDSLLFSQLDTEDNQYVLEPQSIQAALLSALEVARPIAQQHQVQIDTPPECNPVSPTQKELQQHLWQSLQELEQQQLFEDDIDFNQPVIKINHPSTPQHPSQKQVLLAKAFVELFRIALQWSAAQSLLTFSCKVTAKRVIIGLHAQGPTLSEQTKTQFFQLPIQEGIECSANAFGPSIAQRILTLFNAELTVSNRDDQGISLRIALNLAEPIVVL
ncbi:MAG: response regulator [Pseudomonadota bacterium]|nr:response regulator [Pseudomonadota bacterium]